MVTTMSTAFLGLQMALSILWQRSIAWHRDEIVLTMRSKGPKPAMTGNGFFFAPVYGDDWRMVYHKFGDFGDVDDWGMVYSGLWHCWKTTL